MGKILIINGSPRAPKSNSKQYAALFSKACSWESHYRDLTRANHLELCQAADEVSNVLFVFPLYADGIPVTLLNFLKTWEEYGPRQKPTVSVLINCGFLEAEQNNVAVKMMELYCRENGLPFGSVLKIGGGEAILSTPFRILVQAKIKKLARAIVRQENRTFQVTMPLSKKMFLNASTSYWIRYGERHGITREQMASMQIEP